MNRGAARKKKKALKCYVQVFNKKPCDSFCTPGDRQVWRRRVRTVKIRRKTEDRRDSVAYKLS